MAKYIGQRVPCRVKAGDLDLPLCGLPEPHESVPISGGSSGPKIHVVRPLCRAHGSRLSLQWRCRLGCPARNKRICPSGVFMGGALFRSELLGTPASRELLRRSWLDEGNERHGEPANHKAQPQLLPPNRHGFTPPTRYKGRVEESRPVTTKG